MEADVKVSGRGGTLLMIEPVTDKAKEWVATHVDVPSYMWMGRRFAVEHRFVDDIVCGMLMDGLVVEE